MAKAVKAAPKKAAIKRRPAPAKKAASPKRTIQQTDRVHYDPVEGNISWQAALSQPKLREEIIAQLGLTSPGPVSGNDAAKPAKEASPLFESQANIRANLSRIAEQLNVIAGIESRLIGEKKDFVDVYIPDISPDALLLNGARLWDFSGAIAGVLDELVSSLNSRI